MKRLKQWSAILVILFLCSILSACNNQKDNHEEPILDTKAMVDFTSGYLNLEGLALDSDKIAVVRVLDDGVTEQPGSFSTVNQIKVIRPVYNCKKGDVIQHLNAAEYVEEENLYHTLNAVKPMKKGEEYLLFMSLETEDSDQYRDLNQDHGRFILKDGLITSALYNPENQDQTSDHSGLGSIVDYDLENAIEQVEQALDLL